MVLKKSNKFYENNKGKLPIYKLCRRCRWCRRVTVEKKQKEKIGRH